MKMGSMKKTIVLLVIEAYSLMTIIADVGRLLIGVGCRMTFDEWRVLCKGMKAVYTQPNFLPDADSIKIWYKLLQDIPYEVLNVGIQQFMMQSKYAPTVADLRELSTTVVKGKPKDWGSGWESVQQAIRRYGFYQEEKALESMDDITRQTVKRLGWQQLCMSEEPMADRANFRMIFEQIEKRQKAEDVVSLSVKEKMQSLLGASGGLLAIAGRSGSECE